MKNKFILLILALSISKTYAQTNKAALMKKMADSMKMVYLSEIAKRQPLLRQGGISYEIVGKGTTEILSADDKATYKGDLEISRIRGNFNVPIASWGKNNLTGSVAYFQQGFKYGENNLAPGTTLPGTTTRSWVSISASYSRTDSLFNGPVLYTASLTGVTDKLTSIRRVNYTGGVIFPLRQTTSTLTNLGVILVINPNAVIPIPYFSYWHKFTSSNLELNVEIPTGVSVRMPFSSKSWVKLSSAIDPSLTFLKYDSPNYPSNLVQNVLDIRTGLTYERMLSKKLVFGLSGGVITNITSRIQKQSASIDDYIYDNKNSAVPYVNFSLSFLPFLKALK